jgi:alpha-1,3-mannosyltransferase
MLIAPDTLVDTEIDWIAYMQEVEGYLSGERDYLKLSGDTGPLVYPGAFVYLFAVLRAATGAGRNIFAAQVIWAALHTFVIALLCALARRTRHTPVLALLIAVLGTRRVQSIFVLRLFNDCWATALALAAFALLLRWRAGAILACAVFSVAVGVKMNVLLFAPALLAVLLLQFGAMRTVLHLAVCAGVQLLVGAEFLVAAPLSYLVRSFDLGRQFFYIWSVNWQFVPEELFLSAQFKLVLLGAHVGLLALFAYARWLPAWRSTGGSADTVLLMLFSANLIGVACARSLHYQFYVWYFFSLPFVGAQFAARFAEGRARALAWVAFIALMLALELTWNLFPPRASMSALMCACHVMLVAVTWFSFDTTNSTATKRKVQ